MKNKSISYWWSLWGKKNKLGTTVCAQRSEGSCGNGDAVSEDLINLSSHLGSNFMFVHFSLAKPHTWVLVGEILVFLLASYLTVTSSTTKLANMANCW